VQQFQSVNDRIESERRAKDMMASANKIQSLSSAILLLDEQDAGERHGAGNGARNALSGHDLLAFTVADAIRDPLTAARPSHSSHHSHASHHSHLTPGHTSHASHASHHSSR
jgi:hypothetical protein